MTDTMQYVQWAGAVALGLITIKSVGWRLWVVGVAALFLLFTLVFSVLSGWVAVAVAFAAVLVLAEIGKRLRARLQPTAPERDRGG